MADMSGGEIDTAGNSRFISRFISEVVPKAERGMMLDGDGRLSRAGEARIRNALFQLAYGDGYLTEQMAEATDPDSRNMLRAMTGIAARLAAMNADMKRGLLHELDIGGEIAEAYRTVLRQKMTGRTVEEYLAQTSMLGEIKPSQKLLLAMFSEYKNSAKKMTGALDSVLDALEEAGDPRQVGLLDVDVKPSEAGVISEGLRNFRAELEEQQAASERFSLRELEDGTKYVHVDVDQEIFDDVPKNQYTKIARDYIIQRFKGKFVGTENPAYISGRTVKEYTHPANRRLSEDIRTAKMQASTEIDNILDAAEFISHADDDGRNPEAVGGWDYYNVLFNVGGEFFEGIVNIKNSNIGRILYDVTKIKNVTSRISGGMAETNARSASGGNTLSNNIPKDSPDSQVRKSERDRSYLAAVEKGDTRAAQEMVDEAARAAGYKVAAFYETKAEFSEFKPSKTLKVAIGAHFETENAAQDRNKVTGGENVMTVLLNIQNLFTSRDGSPMTEPADAYLEPIAKDRAVAILQITHSLPFLFPGINIRILDDEN